MRIPDDERAAVEALAASLVATGGLSTREAAEQILKETGHKVSHVWVSRACEKLKKSAKAAADKLNKPGRHPRNLRPEAPDDGVVATEIVRADEDEERRKAFLDNCVGLGMDTIDMLRAQARSLKRAAEEGRNPERLVGLTEVVADRAVRILSLVMPLVNGEAAEEAPDDQA